MKKVIAGNCYKEMMKSKIDTEISQLQEGEKCWKMCRLSQNYILQSDLQFEGWQLGNPMDQ